METATDIVTGLGRDVRMKVRKKTPNFLRTGLSGIVGLFHVAYVSDSWYSNFSRQIFHLRWNF